MRRPKGKFHLLLKKGKKGKQRQHIGPPIIRPVRSSKKFRFITLENGLKALLVSERGVNDAAAAMTVRMGSFSDPPDVPGLAHLLEHMLFVGTELEAFASQHGGSANATTKSEHTTFEMGVHNSFLQDALERFARLFIEPLMSTEHLEKVINTIDSEFQLHKPSNESRLEQLRAHTSPKGHCFNRFPWGNKKSLSENKESLRTRLIALFNERCIASSMHLIVLGDAPLSSLQNWVNEFFSPIKDGPKICLVSNPTGVSGSSIWNADTLYQLQSVGQKQTMQIFWMIPALSDKTYLRRPENILVQLLAQETEGSLFSFFKKRLWITKMIVEYGTGTSFSEEDHDTAYSSTSFGRMFSLLLDITDIGLEKKYEIVSYIYQYLQLVRNETLPSHVKQEYTDLLYMKFSCLDTDCTLITDSTLFVQRLAENMITCQAQHVLSMDFLNQDYSDESIKKLLDYFIPENMRIDILSKSIKAEGCEIEPWLESRFVEEKIPVHFIENWKNIRQIDSSLHVPGKNEFMPSTFSIRNHSESSEEKAILLVDEDFKKLYYRLEEGLSSVFFLLDMKVVGDGVKTHVMTKLFLECLEDNLCQIIFQGSEAYLNTSLSLRNDNRVEFTFDGYREKLRLFISRIWKKFISFIPSSEDFQFIKETKVSDFYAELLDLSRHSDQLVSEELLEGCYTTDEKFEALTAITYDDLLRFLPVLRSQICIKGIFFGDFLKDEVMEISRELTLPDPKELRGDEAASMSPSSLGRVPRRLGKGFCRRDAKPYNEFEHNSLAKVYFQVFSEKNQVHQETAALLSFFALMIEAKISEQLRDEENLGYEVKTIAETDLAIKGLSITVISPLKEPEFLLTRIYKVVEEDLWELLDVDEETFGDYKEVVLSMVPSESGISLWKLILEDSDMDFNSDVLIKSVIKMKKEDVISFYRKYFIRSSDDCRRCEVCIKGHGTKLLP